MVAPFRSSLPRRALLKLWPALAAALVVALLVFRSTPALADARTEARSHFKKGMESITAGKYDEGIVELKVAYTLLPHPNVLYNIARAYAEAGDLDEAA